MKRFTELLLPLFILALLLLGSGARADVLYEPVGNSFYEKHMKELTSWDHRYLTNGPEGKTFGYADPLTGEGRTELENGLTMSSSYRYTDKKGNDWLCCMMWDEGPKDYWIPEAYLSRLYDSELFMEDHRAELAQTSGEAGVLGKTVELYEYPGGDCVYRDKVESNDYMTSLGWSLEYTDPEGVKWGYVGYYYGYRECWVKLNAAEDPLQGTQAANKLTMPAPAPYTGEEIKPAEDHRTVLLIATAVLAAAAVFTVCFLKAKKKRQDISGAREEEKPQEEKPEERKSDE